MLLLSMLFEWDNNKNKEIEKRHGFTFEDVVLAIESDFVIINVPNSDRNQKGFLIFISEYPVIAPFEVRRDKYRLITAWPDRRYKDE